MYTNISQTILFDLVVVPLFILCGGFYKVVVGKLQGKPPIVIRWDSLWGNGVTSVKVSIWYPGFSEMHCRHPPASEILEVLASDSRWQVGLHDSFFENGRSTLAKLVGLTGLQELQESKLTMIWLLVIKCSMDTCTFSSFLITFLDHCAPIPFKCGSVCGLVNTAISAYQVRSCDSGSSGFTSGCSERAILRKDLRVSSGIKRSEAIINHHQIS